MRASVFGLGYVGCVTAASLARAGHQVVGVDLNPEKVGMVNAGTSPIVEPGLGELLAEPDVGIQALAAHPHEPKHDPVVGPDHPAGAGRGGLAIHGCFQKARGSDDGSRGGRLAEEFPAGFPAG